jgi:hypothetical protein
MITDNFGLRLLLYDSTPNASLLGYLHRLLPSYTTYGIGYTHVHRDHNSSVRFALSAVVTVESITEHSLAGSVTPSDCFLNMCLSYMYTTDRMQIPILKPLLDEWAYFLRRPTPPPGSPDPELNSLAICSTPLTYVSLSLSFFVFVFRC